MEKITQSISKNRPQETQGNKGNNSPQLAKMASLYILDEE